MGEMLKSFFSRDFGYSPLHRGIEILSILSFFFFITIIISRAYAGLAILGWDTAIWVVPVTLIVGYIAADFASGLVHWMGDTFGNEDVPIFGERFIKPFREHHTHPKGILEHDYVTVNGNNSLVLALFTIPVLLIFNDFSSLFHILIMATCVSFTVGVFMTNQFHKWSHMENPPRYIAFLQKVGLILGPEHHDIHHTAPFDTYYCITCGWLNPVLQKTRFFETMELLATKVLGVKPARENTEQEV